MELFAWIINWLKNEPKKEEFITANEAFQKASDMKNQSKADFKNKLLNDLKRDIKYDVSGPNATRKLCIVRTYSDLQSMEVLPEIAEYFVDKGYDVDLKNGDNYNETNILIISWQNRQMFREEVVE